jgi:N utilization substance protein B
MESPASRKQARVIAFQTLFEYESVGHSAEETLSRHLEETQLAEEVAEYARALVVGTLEHVREIDTRITRAAPAWPLAQMPKVDKSILRIAIFELLFNNRAVPVRVAINEAVELAKSYGGESSSRFVNGVLGTVAGQNGKSEE